MNRIIPRILIILLLSGLLGGGVYYMFFMDQPLRDLGYAKYMLNRNLKD